MRLYADSRAFLCLRGSFALCSGLFLGVLMATVAMGERTHRPSRAALPLDAARDAFVQAVGAFEPEVGAAATSASTAPSPPASTVAPTGRRAATRSMR